MVLKLPVSVLRRLHRPSSTNRRNLYWFLLETLTSLITIKTKWTASWAAVWFQSFGRSRAEMKTLLRVRCDSTQVSTRGRKVVADFRPVWAVCWMWVWDRLFRRLERKKTPSTLSVLPQRVYIHVDGRLHEPWRQLDLMCHSAVFLHHRGKVRCLQNIVNTVELRTVCSPWSLSFPFCKCREDSMFWSEKWVGVASGQCVKVDFYTSS